MKACGEKALRTSSARLLATQRRLMPIVKRWGIALGLNTWNNFEVNYRGDYSPALANEQTIVYADALSDWARLECSINFYLPMMQGLEEDELERIVIHEFIHPLLNEMRGKRRGDDHEERTVTQLMLAFLRVKQMAQKGKLP